MLVDEADALLAGLGSDEHDDTDVVLVCHRLYEVEIVLERKVGNDHTRHARLHTAAEKRLVAIVHDRVEITHEDKRKANLVLDGFELAEQRGQRHAVFQRAGGGVLDDRTVGHGVAERNANLYEVDATAFHGFYHVAGTVQLRTSGTEIERQKLLVAPIGEE